MQEIIDFVKSLYHPSKKGGFTIVVITDTQIMYHSYSKNKAYMIQLGVIQAKTYCKEGRQGVKVFVFDHSTGVLDEIDFIKIY